MQKSNFIDGNWQAGKGDILVSINPATGSEIWRGNYADTDQVEATITAAREAFRTWKTLSLEQRYAYLEQYIVELKNNTNELAEAISLDTGKPLWESTAEIGVMIDKLKISLESYNDRCKNLATQTPLALSITRHRPHGVVLIIGPFNFPGHIPNMHILPALLAGNCVILKPSELTPYISVKIMECWERAGLPDGVINMLQGDGKLASIITSHKHIDGIFFTGSSSTGYKIQDTLLKFPQRIICLEMGGNNPLIVDKPQDIPAAVYNTLLSAFISAGQRCTCARRLILIRDPINEEFLNQLIVATKSIKVGSYIDRPEPFIGPVISNPAAQSALSSYNKLIDAGAKVLVPLQRLDPNTAFLTPSIIDVTGLQNLPDGEIFAPLLKVTWVKDFESAIIEANNTSYGLAAGLLGADQEKYEHFLQEIRAGVVNWNRPTVGASNAAPFGGIAKSGNHRASGYYAADYCAYPVASYETDKLQLPAELVSGVVL